MGINLQKGQKIDLTKGGGGGLRGVMVGLAGMKRLEAAAYSGSPNPSTVMHLLSFAVLMESCFTMTHKITSFILVISVILVEQSSIKATTLPVQEMVTMSRSWSIFLWCPQP